MTPEKILAHKAKVLTDDQRQFFLENGYLLLERFVSDEWLERIWEVTNRMVEESRSWTRSDDKFDLETGHSAKSPRLRRLTQPVEHDPLYWEFASNSMVTDLAADLLGPDVRYHHSKLNFKWSGGGEEVKWHQDIQFYPHTNYSVLATGVYLSDVDDDMAPMAVIPGSHKGELFNQYNDQNEWVGCISDRDVVRVPLQKAVYLKGPAGSVTVHHCRIVHGSKRNQHPTKPRPLLLNSYSSADALPITPNPTKSRYNGEIVRGSPPRWAHFENDPPCPLPPDWSGGYSSIFALQQEEDGASMGIRSNGD